MSQKKIIRLAGVICVGLALCGCAGISTDPGEGGLLGGIKGLSTGEYDRRIDSREARLNTLKDHNRKMEEENLVLKQRNRSLETRVSRMRTQTAAANAKARKVKAQGGSASVNQTEINRLNARLAEIDSERRRLNEAVRVGTINQRTLEQEFDRLDREAIELEKILAHLR